MGELAKESISFLTKPSLDTNGAKLGSLGAVFIMLKSALGAGLLIFPWAFEKAGGIHLAVTVEMISLVFLISGLVILGYSSSISGQNTYQAVVRDVCGPAIGNLCEICYVFNLFFISVAFLVIVADQLQKCKQQMLYYWYTDHRFALFLLCLFFIFPLSLPKEISIQKYTRNGLVQKVSYYRKSFFRCRQSVLEIRCLNTAVLVLLILCLFQFHEACIAVYSSMENRKLSHWVFISVISMFICLIIYSLTGVSGYLTFGKNVAPDILMSYSGSDVTMIVARLLFGISIITIYPIIILLGRSVIQDPLLRRRHKHTAVTESYESRTRVALTTVWVTITLLIAVVVPDISKVISVVGGVGAFFIFIFPGNCFLMFNKIHTYSFTFTITFCFYALFCPRYLLITWGMITLFCGTYIFGQSTSIAIMQLLSDT
uniref:Putative sodium-coupled neutral amino acid transporter 8 n=1 Tax=Sinocyclocheilus anshuiensis TaxID=1608454 RepID=A0A671PFP4_9TELE